MVARELGEQRVLALKAEAVSAQEEGELGGVLRHHHAHLDAADHVAGLEAGRLEQLGPHLHALHPRLELEREGALAAAAARLTLLAHQHVLVGRRRPLSRRAATRPAGRGLRPLAACVAGRVVAREAEKGGF